MGRVNDSNFLLKTYTCFANKVLHNIDEKIGIYFEFSTSLYNIFEMSISAKSLDLRKLLNFVLGFSLKFFFSETKHIFINPKRLGVK